MGRKLVLTGTKLTDTTAPRVVSIDPLESSGSLLLIDPAHRAAAWSAGLPTNGAALPNVVHALAAPLIGADTAPTVGLGGWANGSGKLERTGRGGLHAIVSPTLATTADTFRLRYPVALRAYMLANKAHRFYVSTWTRTTRDSTPQYRVLHQVSSSTGAGSNYLYYARPDTHLPSGSQLRRGAHPGIGPRMDAQSATAWTGTPPTTHESGMIAEVIPAGTSAFAYDSTLTRQTGAAVLYRHYVEDLTVSGRTAAEVEALDYALFRREVLEAGGRYYGDTYTDPATVA